MNITGCKCHVDDNLILLYKLCIGLSILFSLGCCCNVLFCCLNVRGKNTTKKRRSVPKTIAQNTLTRNQYWINEPVTQRNGNTFGWSFTDCIFYRMHLEEFPTSQYTEMKPTNTTEPVLPVKRNSLTSYASLRPRPKTQIDHPVSLVGYHPSGPALPTNDTNNNLGFQYDTNANSIISALSNYNTNRNSPPRSSGYEVPNNKTFHSASNSVSTSSPRNSLDHGHGINPATQQLIASTSSAPTAHQIQPLQDSEPQFLTLASLAESNAQPLETYSIL